MEIALTKYAILVFTLFFLCTFLDSCLITLDLIHPAVLSRVNMSKHLQRSILNAKGKSLILMAIIEGKMTAGHQVSTFGQSWREDFAIYAWSE